MAEARLIAYAPEHDAATVRWLSSEDLRRAFGFRGEITPESHRRWVEASPQVRLRAVVDAEGRHVGNTLLHLSPRHASAYLQIYIGEASKRGRGVGAAAFALTLAEGFEQVGLHRIWLHTLPGNDTAERLYERHGFRREGCEREAFRDGERFVDQQRWSLLAPEWRAAR